MQNKNVQQMKLNKKKGKRKKKVCKKKCLLKKYATIAKNIAKRRKYSKIV